MRPVPCTALLLLLALLPPPASAQEPPITTALRPRTLFWAPGAAPVELHIAAGSATVVHLEAFPQAHPLEPSKSLPGVRLLPADESSFVLLPSSDFAPGEQARLTVKLGPPPALELPLLLVSREEAVDSQVRIVQLRPPSPEEQSVVALAQALNATSQEQGNLTVKGPLLCGAKVWVQVESILRLDSRVFVALVTYSRESTGRPAVPWKMEQARLRVLLEGGVPVELPLLLVSSPPMRGQQRHTLVAPLPARAVQLSLSVEGEGVPEGFHPLPLDAEAPPP
jgi:hypothetical protein